MFRTHNDRIGVHGRWEQWRGLGRNNRRSYWTRAEWRSAHAWLSALTLGHKPREPDVRSNGDCLLLRCLEQLLMVTLQMPANFEEKAQRWRMFVERVLAELCSDKGVPRSNPSQVLALLSCTRARAHTSMRAYCTPVCECYLQHCNTTAPLTSKRRCPLKIQCHKANALDQRDDLVRRQGRLHLKKRREFTRQWQVQNTRRGLPESTRTPALCT